MSQSPTAISGVVTTGIYCRAGCPASPKQINIQTYASPVAAEAVGFRPCLRCRPDRLPPPSRADDVPDAVAGALLLIAEGALDDSTEEQIAGRVGLSGRQLRRLFIQHVGATPALVGRSRRAHFARRLLDETDLTVAEITFAAGFSSVRQMNRVMQEVFRFPPTDLRSRRRQRDRLVTDGGLPLRAPYTAPFSLSDQARFLKQRAVAGLEAVGPDRYRRTISTCGHPGMIEVSDVGDGAHLLVLAHLPTFTALIDDVARVRRIFGVDQPPASSIASLMSDPLLAPLIAERPGLRLVGAWDRFEMAVRIIASQQISLRAARTILARILERYGEAVPGLAGVGLTHVFPTAARLAHARETQLVALGLTSARAATLRRFARAYASEEISLQPSVPLGDLLQQLLALPGVGPWTAECIALRAVGHLDAFPAEDLGIRKALAARVGENGSGTVDVNECRDRAEAWRPYRGIAAMHLWAAEASL